MTKSKRTIEEYNRFVTKHQEEWLRVGYQILTIRKILRVSQKELAKRAGICVATLHKLERGAYIRRFKPISSSCINALKTFGYEGLIAIQM